MATSSVRILSSMAGPAAQNNLKIVDGELDRLIESKLELKSRPKRSRKVKGGSMATTTVTPNAATEKKEEVKPNYTLGVPQTDKPNTPEIDLVSTDYGFKLRGNGDHTVSRKLLDLDSLERKFKYNTFKVQLLDNRDQLAEMESDRLIALVNLGLQKESLMAAKAAIGVVSNAKAVNDFINNFRPLPQFAVFVKDITDKSSAEDKSAARKNQTKGIVEFIKTIPGLFDQLKQIAATKPKSAEGEAETEEEDDEE